MKYQYMIMVDGVNRGASNEYNDAMSIAYIYHSRGCECEIVDNGVVAADDAPTADDAPAAVTADDAPAAA